VTLTDASETLHQDWHSPYDCYGMSCIWLLRLAAIEAEARAAAEAERDRLREGWRDAAVDAHVFAGLHPAGRLGGPHTVEFIYCLNDTCAYRRAALAARPAVSPEPYCPCAGQCHVTASPCSFSCIEHHEPQP
jgi:hypothetical protein